MTNAGPAFRSEADDLGMAHPTLIVAIGASAGGFEAMQELFRDLPPNTNCAFVVVQHHDQASHATLRELLSKVSKMPLRAASDRTGLEPNVIYVAPPEDQIELHGNELRIVPPHRSPFAPLPIDRFLQSLAEAKQADAVGIVLTGTGSDGTLGLKAVSEAGGMTIVQSLDTAKFTTMPQSALTMVMVDHVLGPSQIADEIANYAAHVSLVKREADGKEQDREIEQLIGPVSDLLEQGTSHNFRHYKPSTLVRRIKRRMQVLKLPSVEQYLEHLKGSSEEASTLFRELLIGVTSFFRDAEAFQSLDSLVLESLFAPEMPRGRTVRIWVPGCATGEEAYSLAMLCRERMDRMTAPPLVQIFATDIDDRALQVARKGLYPSGIAEQVSAERLARFFVKRGNRYQVTQSLREMMLFSIHNLISDPPFSRQDLISCRNLLIYLGPHLQKKLVSLFHYALRPGGYLFLGPSENIASHRELFRVLDPKNRISQCKPTAVQSIRDFDNSRARAAGNRFLRATEQEVDLQQVMQRIVLDEFAPKSVVVNEEGHVLCSSGDMHKFLTLTGGTFQNNIVKLCRTGIRVGLRAALQEAHRTRRRVVDDSLALRDGQQMTQIRLTVQPMPRLGEESGLFLVVFEQLNEIVNPRRGGANDLAAETMIAQLEHELETTRVDLERSVQELESLNEELKSSNEELLSMNEELQSANEELETSKEEVQAGNAALTRAKSDLENLLQSTQIATLFLDEELRVKRFTPAAMEIYNLIESDVGRPIWHQTHHLIEMPPYPNPKQKGSIGPDAVTTVRAKDGRWFIRSVKPYVGRGGGTEGIVVTFVDITEQKRHEATVHEFSERMELAMRAGEMGAWDWDIATEFIHLDRIVAQFYGLPDAGAVRLSELIQRVHAQDRRGLKRAIQQTLDDGRDYAHEFRIVDDAGKVRWMAARGRLLKDHSGKARRFVGVNFDITQRKRHEERLRDSEQQLLLLANSLPVLVGYVDRRQRYRFVNDAYLREWDQSRENIVGRHVSEVIGHEAYSRARPHIEAALAGHRQNFELVFRSERSATWRSNDVTYVPRYDARGEVLGFYVLVIDMTAVRESVEAVRRSEQFLRKTLDTLYAFVGICTPEGILIEANRTALQAANLKPEEVLGKHFADTYWWSYSPEIQQKLRESIELAAQGRATRYDVPVRVADDRRIVIDFQLVPMLDNDGRVTHLIPSAIDVTQQREAVEQLRNSEERLRLASEAAGFGTYDMDLLSGEVVWSEGTRGILGYTVNSPIPIRSPYLPDVTHPEDRADVQLAIDRSLRSDGSGELDIEHRIVRADDQTTRWIRVQGKTIFGGVAPARKALRAVGTMIDVTDRKQSELALRLRDRAIAAARNGIVLLDARQPDFPIIYVNGGFTRITEWEVDEVLGQSLSLLRGTATDPQAIQKVLDALTSRQECRVELRLVTKLGRPIWSELNVTPVQDNVNGVTHFVAVLNDISEQKRTEEQLRFAQKEAEAANRSKSDFLANMSHEIRTPMTAILGYADLLAKHLTDGDDLLSVQTIRRNGQFLLEIINDILDVSKIEAGKLELHHERFSVADLVGEVHSLMEVRAREKSLPFEVEFETEIPATIYSDEKRVRQVLINLIGNAIKFTYQGQIRLLIRLEQQGGQPQIHFSVIDTGIGISRDLKDRLFEPFSQADTSAARRFEGTGLGLTISRRLTELLGGQIGVESEPGRGSTFFFTIATGELEGVTMQMPRQTSQDVVVHEDPAIETISGRILVADDRREVRYLAQHFIEEAGGEVVTAENGLLAVQAVQDGIATGKPFCLILMDMQMPVLDGYHAVKQLRELGIHTPIVALTAHAMQGDRERCLAVGCDEYLTKPIDRDELLRVLLQCQRQVANEITEFDRESTTASDGDIRESHTSASSHAGEGKASVLIIDDRHDACTALQRLLELEGFRVSVSINAAQGFQTACQLAPDAILMDLGLPDESGYDLARRLKTQPTLSHTVLIALTGRTEEEARQLATAAGFDHFVVKPAALDELMKLLRFQDDGA
jgi:PAS domain S-box-containing protein